MNCFDFVFFSACLFTPFCAANLLTGDDQHLNGDQSNNGNTHHGDDDGRMTFKIPNMGGQVI